MHPASCMTAYPRPTQMQLHLLQTQSAAAALTLADIQYARFNPPRFQSLAQAAPHR